MGARVLRTAAVVFFLIAGPRLEAVDFYVAPYGAATGIGTRESPWRLETALAHPEVVGPGDTIWLRGGSYRGKFQSVLQGTPRAPILVRAFPGERPIIDGNDGSGSLVEALRVNGADTWFRGFEVTNSVTVRTTTGLGGTAPAGRGDGIDTFGPGTRFINIISHDNEQGINAPEPAIGAELYGNIIYYNGHDDFGTRGHGHGIYTQNFIGTKHIRENLVFGQYGYGLHAYTEGSHLDNFVVEGNAFFLNGGLSRVSGFSTDILLGANGSPATSCTSSEKVAHKPVLRDNLTFQPPNGGIAINLGYSKGTCDGTVIGNHAVGRDAFLLINAFGNVNVSGNTFIGSISGISPSSFPENTYLSSRPAGIEVFVRPNAYETGRGHVLVYNWDRAQSVDVDLSSILVAGGPFEIRSASNIFGPPLVFGVYSGAKVRLPLTGLPVAIPVGASAPPDWPEDFQAFVVLPPDGTFVATRVIPVIVDTLGQKGAHFSTEITLANRGVTPASMSLRYVASPKFGGPSGTVTDTLPPGVQLVIPDAISYLRSRGLPLGSGSQGGSLSVTFTGLSGPEASYAAARITSPSGSGRAGTAFASVRPEDGFDSRATVFGLRESDRERSNLAFVNLATSGSITLTLTAFSGEGDGRTAALTPLTLGAGEWIQVGSPLAAAGFDNGFIEVERIAGTGRFFTYGVVNDNLTNDGAFMPPVQDEKPPEGQTLPVIVESGTFDSDLVLTNPGSQPVTATLSYVESLASPAGGVPFRTDIALGGFEQRLIPSAIEFLRKQGLSIEPRGGAGHAGAVGVQFSRDGNPAQGYAGALTASPAAQGGRYGVFYNGIPVSHAAASDAWVFGLQQNDIFRSNLAIASVGDAGEPVMCHLQVYDGDTGRMAGQVGPFVVQPRGWLQVPHVLAGFGVSNGYVRVVGTTGADRLVVYGVVNDGGTPSSGRTNDGSFISSPTN